MRDIVVLIFLIGCVIAALKKPWYGVLSMAVFSYMNPHAYAWGFVRTLPVFQILFIVVALKTLTTTDKQPIPRDWRIPVFFILWFYFFLTTTQAYVSILAWERLWLISKIYIPFIFTLILINTREKLFYLIITIAFSIGIIALKGGIFAVLSGFAHRVYGPPATQFYENNAFAIAVLIAIPLLLLWLRETSSKWIKNGIMLSIPFIFSSAISSWSRGAMVTIAVLTLILIWHSKRKYLAIPLVLIGIYFVKDLLPEEWFGRMQTMQSFSQDASALGRLQAWKDGWNHTVNVSPFFGAGFEGWRYVTERDWHNSYIEMLAEHGFIAFGLWISLILGTVISLTILPRKTRGIDGMEWVKNYCFMLRTSLICYMTGTMFLGLAYWDILYHLIFIAVLVKKFALEELAENKELSLENNTEQSRKKNIYVNQVPPV